MQLRKNTLGFTLIEMLLVIAIMASIFLMIMRMMEQRFDAMRRQKAATQMQQILNAGLAYYVVNNKWPALLSDLQGAYLPGSAVVPLNNPWQKPYTIYSTPVPNPMTPAFNVGSFYVFSDTASGANGTIVAGMLPLAYTATAPGSPPAQAACPTLGPTICYAVAQVNVPPQNVNKARSSTFAGIYSTGGCVPVPTCPLPSMTPEIFVTPARVTGADIDPGCTVDPTGTITCSSPMTPTSLTSFTAKALGPAVLPTSFSTMMGCGGIMGACEADVNASGTYTGTLPAGKYWRVCLYVTTDATAGPIQPGGVAWGIATGSVMAITRCVIRNTTGTGEDQSSSGSLGSRTGGSNLNVWAP